VHKTANVLNKLPKSQQAKAKRALEEIWMAETKKDALIAFDAFVEIYDIKCQSLNLSFQSLSREIATRHSSHGGEFGERIDSVKDAEHRLRRRERSSRP